MTRAEIASEVLRIAAEHCVQDKVELTASFEDDLLFDSLDCVEYLLAIEERFSCSEISEDEARLWKTPQDVVNFLVRQQPPEN